MSALKEFKDFAVKGNVVDMAIGVIVGAAFAPIVSSLVNDIIMPPIGLALGRVDFSNLFIDLSGKAPPSVAEAKKLGLATINYGLFINVVINFLIVAFLVFLMARQINRLKKKDPAPDPTTKDCPFCLSAIPIKATKCAHCTSAV